MQEKSLMVRCGLNGFVNPKSDSVTLSLIYAGWEKEFLAKKLSENSDFPFVHTSQLFAWPLFSM